MDEDKFSEIYADFLNRDFIKDGIKSPGSFVQDKWSKYTKESEDFFSSGIDAEKVRSLTEMPYFLAKYIAGI